MTPQEFEDLQNKVEEAKRAADKAEARLDMLKKELQKEFGCKTIKQAKKLLERLRKTEQEQEEAFSQSLRDFEERYGNLL